MIEKAKNCSRTAQGRRRLSFETQFAVAQIALAIAMSLAVAPGDAVTNLDGLEDPHHFVQRDGGSIYRAICQGCHMPDGKGAQEGAGHYPALAQNPSVGNTPYILHNVIHGRYGMPGFGAALDDAQIAAVANYVRTHFGNHFDDTVKAEDAKAERENAD
jgi:mono/diheme cytochrome c family protein